MKVGEVIGRKYRVDRVLGAGGMGIVVAATHLELGQQVALKLLRQELSRNATLLDRFLREARSIAALRTEHVCRVFDVGRTDDDAPFIVMELLRGADLAATVARQPLPVALAVDYVIQACVALHEAHALGLVHRDLKPANLFVTRRDDGRPLVKVLDFGIAKAADALRLTHSTAPIGSPGYMSPEQLVTPRDVDARTDIWSLGVTLYQLVSARLPFPSSQLTEYTVAATRHDPLPLDVDPRLRAIVWQCLAKDPRARPADVTTLVTALAAFASPAGKLHAAQIGAPHPGAGGTLGGIGVPGELPIAPIKRQTPSIDERGTLGTVNAPARTVPPSRRWLAVAVALVLIAAAGIVLAIVATGSSGTVATPVLDDAGATLALGSPLDVAPPIPIDAADAAELADAAVELPDAAVPPDAPGPRPRRPPSDPPEPADVTHPHLSDPRIAAQIAEAEEALKNVEALMVTHHDKPEVLQNLYAGAIQTACFLNKVRKARSYFRKITDKGARMQARGTCLIYKIEL